MEINTKGKILPPEPTGRNFITRLVNTRSSWLSLQRCLWGAQITAMAEMKNGQPFAAIFKLVEQGWKDEHGFSHQPDDVLSFFSALCSSGFNVSIVID